MVRIAMAFAVIQTLFLWLGWAFGYLIVGFVSRIAHVIGFLLLLYVGGSMLYEGIKGDEESMDLNGLKHVILGGIATSIDALAVGGAEAMEGTSCGDGIPLIASVFVVTALSVVVGLSGGRKIRLNYGRWAEIAGGIVLIAIGVNILLG